MFVGVLYHQSYSWHPPSRSIFLITFITCAWQEHFCLALTTSIALWKINARIGLNQSLRVKGRVIWAKWSFERKGSEGRQIGEKRNWDVRGEERRGEKGKGKERRGENVLLWSGLYNTKCSPVIWCSLSIQIWIVFSERDEWTSTNRSTSELFISSVAESIVLFIHSTAQTKTTTTVFKHIVPVTLNNMHPWKQPDITWIQSATLRLSDFPPIQVFRYVGYQLTAHRRSKQSRLKDTQQNKETKECPLDVSAQIWSTMEISSPLHVGASRL